MTANVFMLKAIDYALSLLGIRMARCQNEKNYNKAFLQHSETN